MSIGVMLILVCDDDHMFFDVDGRSILADFPLPLVVFCNRRAAASFAGLGAAVEVCQVAWGNPDNIREAARALSRTRPVLAIGTGNEALIDLAAELREELGIAGMWRAQAALFRDKLLMKQVLADAGLRVPACTRCSEPAEVARLLAAHGKLVVKPVDGFGSRAVTFIDAQAQFDAWLAGEALPEQFEAEEFIDGTLYHVNAMLCGGAVKLSASAIYLPGMANIDFRAGTPFVSVLLEEGSLKRRLEAFSSRALAALRLVDGISHLECFVTPDDDIVLCEVAARPGGGGIVQMIEAQHGVNYSRASLLLQAGQGGLLAPVRSRSDVIHGLIGFRLPRNCTIEAIATRADFAEDWIRHVRFYAAPGQFVPAARHCTDFVCLLVFASDDHAHFLARLGELSARFDATLATSAGAMRTALRPLPLT